VQVHLVDGTYELFRAWFGAPPAQHAGREVGAVRSIVRSFAMLLSRGTITHAGVAYDHVIESFRNDLFAGYKTGEGVPEGLFAQFELAERATTALGLVAWPMIEFEADDAIATAAHHLAADPRVDRVLITAVDKDMCQCVAGTRIVCWDRFKDVTLDEPAVIAKHGVPPAAIPDLLALIGDTADGIPGLEGWGKVSAAKLLSAYGSLAAIPDDPAKWTVSVRGADRLAASLRDHRAEATLYRTLATLRVDCPIPCAADALAWRGVDRPAIDAICVELGLEAGAVKLADRA
jgi:5'-3' exonuclease